MVDNKFFKNCKLHKTKSNWKKNHCTWMEPRRDLLVLSFPSLSWRSLAAECRLGIVCFNWVKLRLPADITVSNPRSYRNSIEYSTEDPPAPPRLLALGIHSEIPRTKPCQDQNFLGSVTLNKQTRWAWHQAPTSHGRHSANLSRKLIEKIISLLWDDFQFWSLKFWTLIFSYGESLINIIQYGGRQKTKS